MVVIDASLYRERLTDTAAYFSPLMVLRFLRDAMYYDKSTFDACMKRDLHTSVDLSTEPVPTL